jgi:hypothetical protein
VLEALSKQKQVSFEHIEGRFWFSINSVATYSSAEDEIIARFCYHEEDSIVIKQVYRPITRGMIKGLSKIPLKPVQFSLISLFGALIICLVFAYGTYATLAFGGILTFVLGMYQLSVQAVTKVRFERTPFTKWRKEVLIKYMESLLLLGLIVHCVHSWNGQMHSFAIGVFALVGIMMFHYSRDKYMQMVHDDPPKNHDLYMNWATRWFVLAIGCVLNLPLLALAVLAIILNGLVIRRLFTWYR